MRVAGLDQSIFGLTRGWARINQNPARLGPLTSLPRIVSTAVWFFISSAESRDTLHQMIIESRDEKSEINSNSLTLIISSSADVISWLVARHSSCWAVISISSHAVSSAHHAHLSPQERWCSLKSSSSTHSEPPSNNSGIMLFRAESLLSMIWLSSIITYTLIKLDQNLGCLDLSHLNTVIHLASAPQFNHQYLISYPKRAVLHKLICILNDNVVGKRVGHVPT